MLLLISRYNCVTRWLCWSGEWNSFVIYTPSLVVSFRESYKSLTLYTIYLPISFNMLQNIVHNLYMANRLKRIKLHMNVSFIYIK